MSRELKILDPGVSRNQSKILPYMAKIGGGTPSTRQKENLMACTGTTHTTKNYLWTEEEEEESNKDAPKKGR